MNALRSVFILLGFLIILECFPAQINAQSQTHTVEPGETLFRIALQYNVSVQALIVANNIANPSVIYVGQVLIIPSPENSSTVSSTPTASVPISATATVIAESPNENKRIHVVKRGEGLLAIARIYGVSWTAIASLNNIPDANMIYAGMILKIPDTDPLQTIRKSPTTITSSEQGGKLILVVLGEQRVYAYENGKLLRNVLVSTGLPATPTVQGKFKIYLKYKAQTMSGPGYYLPDVPWVMYFYQGYGLHGTYWHSNFGQPMSHGCVNLPTEQAKWFFEWAELGTSVHVRP